MFENSTIIEEFQAGNTILIYSKGIKNVKFIFRHMFHIRNKKTNLYEHDKYKIETAIFPWAAKEDDAFINNFGSLWIWWPQIVFFSILRKAYQIVFQFFPFFVSFQGLENSGSIQKITIWPRFT